MKNLHKTVKNTANKIWTFVSAESTLVTIGWIAFVLGAGFVACPYGKVTLLALSRVLP
ncbi:TPA: hypothetical protein ACGU7E_004558 [Vibrio vulnificus]|uniref:hypothetical protein n=1 Tax=Vibrio vulnificus TaxID=672 RepID=UPI0028CF939E|nr:hypothetical protein [Vibrio vulnificus]